MEENFISPVYYLPWCVWSNGGAGFPCDGVNTLQQVINTSTDKTWTGQQVNPINAGCV